MAVSSSESKVVVTKRLKSVICEARLRPGEDASTWPGRRVQRAGYRGPVKPHKRGITGSRTFWASRGSPNRSASRPGTEREISVISTAILTRHGAVGLAAAARCRPNAPECAINQPERATTFPTTRLQSHIELPIRGLSVFQPGGIRRNSSTSPKRYSTDHVAQHFRAPPEPELNDLLETCNILRRRHIGPVPGRSRTAIWVKFIRSHVDVLARPLN